MVEHDQIDSRLDALCVILEAAKPNPAAAICALCDLAAELGDHLAHEDSFIYPKMIDGNDVAASRIARDFVSHFDELRHDWNLYLSEWQPECIEHDWETFRYATGDMIKRLSKRVRAENLLLYSAALQNGFIALRETALSDQVNC